MASHGGFSHYEEVVEFIGLGQLVGAHIFHLIDFFPPLFSASFAKAKILNSGLDVVQVCGMFSA